jgi:hypothetical protein
MEREALIVIPRSKKYWFAAIPELRSYQKVHFTNSYGNITLSENNLGADSFDKVVKELHKDGR